MIEKLLSSEVQKFIKDHQFDDPFLLSLNTKVDDDFPLKAAAEQIQAKQKAKNKLPSWFAKENIIWPPPISIEQSSSELTARYKASLLQGKSIVDLTAGMGVDSSYFTDRFEEVVYVEPDKNLCELAQHNFHVLEKEIEIINSSAENFLERNARNFDAVFIDPSRRSGERKVFKIEDCIPNVYEIVNNCFTWTDQVLIKLSPLADLSLLVRDFEPSRICVVAVKGEVKEVLCLIKEQKEQVKVHAVDLQSNEEMKDFNFIWDEEAKSINDYSLPLQYIYEPNAAILKSGAFKLVGKRYQLYKLHQHSHLYTSNSYLRDFPGKTLKVVEILGQRKKEVHKAIPVKKINVITRNYSLTSEQLKKKYGLKDGGEHFLIGTTLVDGTKVIIICSRVHYDV